MGQAYTIMFEGFVVSSRFDDWAGRIIEAVVDFGVVFAQPTCPPLTPEKCTCDDWNERLCRTGD